MNLGNPLKASAFESCRQPGAYGPPVFAFTEKVSISDATIKGIEAVSRLAVESSMHDVDPMVCVDMESDHYFDRTLKLASDARTIGLTLRFPKEFVDTFPSCVLTESLT